MRKKASNPLKGMNAPWITEDGDIDPGKFPIDQTLERTLDQDFEEFRQACSVLRLMHQQGKIGAAIYLLGLLHHYRDNYERLIEIVTYLQGYKTRECAEALLSEIRRVKSSNTTRRYINTILKALSSFPLEMVENGLTVLAEDKTFTYKMRNKFSDLIEEKRWGDN